MEYTGCEYCQNLKTVWSGGNPIQVCPEAYEHLVSAGVPVNALRIQEGGYGVEVIVRGENGSRCEFFGLADWEQIEREHGAYTADLAHRMRGRDMYYENGVSPEDFA